MLEFIRSRAQGFFAWLIVGGIIITFALFGINQYLSGGGDNSVAKVNGAGISPMQLERAYGQQRQRLAQMFGGKLPPMFTEKMLKQQALSQLVSQEVIVQAAHENGIRVGDTLLSSLIRSADVFKENGKFSRTKYETLLRNQGMSPGMFEEQVRRDIIASQFESGYRDTTFVTKAEVDNLLRLQNQQRSIGYLTVAIAPYTKSATVTDAEIQQFYKENQQRFMMPERIKVSYLDLNVDAITDAIKVDDAMLKARYDAQKMNYATPEERRARHILIKVPEDASKDKVDAARTKAQSILQKIKQGEDFAKLAMSESDDPGSAKRGGDLGYFGRGAMVPAFEDAVFSMKKGEVSDLVRSPFGFHIIQLEGIRGGDVEPFDKVKDKIRKDIKREKAEQKFYDMAEQLANLTYEHPESLQVASEELGLPIQTSDFFTRQGGKGIASNPKVVSAAFSDDVLARDNNSETIELGRNRMVVVRIKEHHPEMERPLDEVKEAISNKLKQDKAREQVKAQADALLNKVRDGEKPASLAVQGGITWQPKETLTRDDKKTDGAILKEAFSMPAPQNDGISSGTVALDSGAEAVVVLYDVMDGDPAKADDKQRSQARAQLLRSATNAITSEVMDGVRGRMDITIKK